MNPKRNSAVFIGTAFELVLPYPAFGLYFTPRLPQNNWPSWFTNTLLARFVANLLILTLLAKKMFKKPGREVTKTTPLPRAEPSPAIWILRILGTCLVLVWSVLFLIGVKGTIEGKYPLSRALPAGAFLLFFIGLLAWSIFRSFKKKA